jgi:hypothetical protein
VDATIGIEDFANDPQKLIKIDPKYIRGTAEPIDRID